MFPLLGFRWGRVRQLDEARQIHRGETGAFGLWCRLTLATSTDLKQRGQTYSSTTTVHDTMGNRLL